MDTSIITQRLAEQVRSMRLNRGYTQAYMAQLAGVTRQKLIEIEQGSPSVSMNAYARVIAALDSEVKLMPASKPTLEELRDMFND